MFGSSSSSGRSCAGRRPTRPLSWDADARALSRRPARRPSVGARLTRMERTYADRTGMPCDAPVPDSHTRHARLMSSDGAPSRVGALNVLGGNLVPVHVRRSVIRFTKERSLSTCLRGQAPHCDGIGSSPLRIEAGVSLCRTMTYSKGAPGEVMLDGTVSDPVACPSCSSIG
jgi:hypothetical protein